MKQHIYRLSSELTHTHTVSASDVKQVVRCLLGPTIWHSIQRKWKDPIICLIWDCLTNFLYRIRIQPSIRCRMCASVSTKLLKWNEMGNMPELLHQQQIIGTQNDKVHFIVGHFYREHIIQKRCVAVAVALFVSYPLILSEVCLCIHRKLFGNKI